MVVVMVMFFVTDRPGFGASSPGFAGPGSAGADSASPGVPGSAGEGRRVYAECIYAQLCTSLIYIYIYICIKIIIDYHLRLHIHLHLETNRALKMAVWCVTLRGDLAGAAWVG